MFVARSELKFESTALKRATWLSRCITTSSSVRGDVDVAVRLLAAILHRVTVALNTQRNAVLDKWHTWNYVRAATSASFLGARYDASATSDIAFIIVLAGALLDVRHSRLVTVGDRSLWNTAVEMKTSSLPRVVHRSILCDPIQPNPSAD